jgi:carbon-monoxide dehydrogenase medium subunit
MLKEFKYLSPSSEEELLNLLATHKGKARLLAGGTNVLVDIRGEWDKPDYVIDIKKIPGLKDINFSEEKGLFIGAAVTCNEVLENKVIREKYPMVIRGGEELASYQIRNRATVVGNLCYGSPAADMAPPLLVLDTKVIIVSSKGEKHIALKEFFKGVKKTVLSDEEFVKGIIIPAENSYMKGDYKKSKRVKGHDLSIVSVAMGRIKNKLRVAIGSCAPVPVLLEEFHEDTPLTEIIEKANKSVCPIDDLRGSKDYRLNMMEVYIKRLYEKRGEV